MNFLALKTVLRTAKHSKAETKQCVRKLRVCINVSLVDHCVSGACVHRLVSSERHALGVRQGRQEKRADQEPRHTLRTNTEGTPGMLTN